MKLPVTFDPAIIEELAEHLVSHHLHAYREGIANAYDADSPKIVIENSPQKISFEDWGSGIEDLDVFCHYGSARKREILQTPVYGRKPIGRKGLGFISYWKLGNQITLSINNGIVGYRVIRKKDDPMILDATPGSADSFLNHKGLKAEITKLKRMADDKELRDYLKKYFSLIMCRGFSITLNGKELIPRKLLSTVKIETKFGQIVGDFVNRASGVADLYCCGVFVRKELIDATRMFQAWVDCDFLEPDSARGDFVKDNLAWKSFLEAIKTYILRYPRSGETRTPLFELAMKKLFRALGNVSVELGVRVEGEIPTSASQGETPTIKGETGQCENRDKSGTHNPVQKRVPSYDKMHTFLPTGNIEKVLKTDYGIKLVPGYLQDELSPLVPQTPNIIVYNRSSDILKAIAIEEKRTHSASTIYLFIPYLARAYVHLLPKEKTEDPENLTDKIANGLYKRLFSTRAQKVPTELKQDLN